MIAWTARRGAVVLAWLKGLLVAASIVAIALQWTNTRIIILRQNQNPAHPTAPVTYPAFHSMATGLREGRIGQVDLEAFEQYSVLHDPLAPFDRLPAGAAHRWANYVLPSVAHLRGDEPITASTSATRSSLRPHGWHSRRCRTTIFARWRCSS